MKAVNVGTGGSQLKVRLRNPQVPQLVIPSLLVKALLGRDLRSDDTVYLVPYVHTAENVQDLILFLGGVKRRALVGRLKAWRSNLTGKVLYVSAVNILQALGLKATQWPKEGCSVTVTVHRKIVVHVKGGGCG